MDQREIERKKYDKLLNRGEERRGEESWNCDDEEAAK